MNIKIDTIKEASKVVLLALWILLKVFLAVSFYDKSTLTFIYAGF